MFLRHTLLLLPLACVSLPSLADIPARPVISPDSLQGLRQAAEAGDTGAMVSLAWRLFQGQGVHNDDEAAVRWFRAAADRGSGAGMYGLAWCQRWGRGIAPDKAAAEVLMRKAADLGNAAAQNDVGETLHDLGDRTAAHGWYAKAAAQGHTDAMWHLGRNLLHGWGAAAEPAGGLAWLRKSAEAGNSRGMYYLALALDDGTAVPKDHVAARGWYRKSMELGDAHARHELAGMLLLGNGGEQDSAQAVQLFHRGGAEGHKDSVYTLTLIYANGRGVKKDPSEAQRWLDKGVELGDVRAMVRLGHLLLNGSDRPVDKPAAARLFQRAAAAGDAAGAFWIAQCLELGNGVPKDEAAAAHWYAEAGRNGVLAAQNFLLAMRFDGRGVPRDRAGAEAHVDQEIAAGNAANMLDLATKMVSRRQFADAEIVVRRVYAVPAPSGARAGAVFAGALGDLGTAYHRQQKLGQARMHLAAQITVLESLPGTTAETLAAALDYLGEVDSEDGRLDEAEAGFRRALALRMKSTGEMDNGVAESHASLSRLYVSRDQMARAEFHIRKVVAIREQLFGAASSQASHSRAALAQVLYESGKYGEAQPLFEQALALIEEKLGKEHPHILNDLNNLAYNERAQRRHEQALTTFRRVLAGRQADFGDRAHHSVASALTGLGAALVEAGQLREAEARLLAGLAMREQLLGPDHVDLAYSMTELGRLYIAQGRHADADKALLRALRIIEAAIGKDHSEVAAVLYEQGRSLQAQGRASEAAASWKRALAIRLRAGPGHPATRETAELLSSLYRKAGDARAAEKVEADMAAAAREASASGAAAVPGT